MRKTTNRLKEIEIRIGRLYELDTLISQKESEAVFQAGDFEVQRLFKNDLNQILYCSAEEGSMNNHMHPLSDEWFQVIKGAIKIVQEDASIILKEGEYYKIRKMEKHSVIVVEPTEFVCGLIPPEKEYE